MTVTGKVEFEENGYLVARGLFSPGEIEELCDRFGEQTYLSALDALLERNLRAMRELITQHIPTEPVTFADYVDDDGLGQGPYKLMCTMWREGDRVGAYWLAWGCGECARCRSGRENLCRRSEFTGWDRDGGFADRMLVEAELAPDVPPGQGGWLGPPPPVTAPGRRARPRPAPSRASRARTRARSRRARSIATSRS